MIDETYYGLYTVFDGVGGSMNGKAASALISLLRNQASIQVTNSSG